MENLEKLKSIFSEALQINDINSIEKVKYGETSEWDSIIHMELVSKIEEEFDIMLDSDEIIDLSCLVKAQEILGSHDVSF